ncbi:MAG TPA: type II toxin-antitoxin system prevent-host-death family antitoxin [Polyangia bacterium]
MALSRHKPKQVAAASGERGGRVVSASRFTATAAKADFGNVLDIAARGGVVFITKHDVPRAVMISTEQFNLLSNSAERQLDGLRREFDAVLTNMQKRDVRKAAVAAFGASPKELGRAAVAALRKRD